MEARREGGGEEGGRVIIFVCEDMQRMSKGEALVETPVESAQAPTFEITCRHMQVRREEEGERRSRSPDDDRRATQPPTDGCLI